MYNECNMCAKRSAQTVCCIASTIVLYYVHSYGECKYPLYGQSMHVLIKIYLQNNKPQGNGIFLSPQGDKYIGQWAGGKKHGKGRYLFTTGDFYDGEFCKNNAQGMGVYYHTNGNIFTGQWVSLLVCVCFSV